MKRGVGEEWREDGEQEQGGMKYKSEARREEGGREGGRGKDEVQDQRGRDRDGER